MTEGKDKNEEDCQFVNGSSNGGLSYCVWRWNCREKVYMYNV